MATYNIYFSLAKSRWCCSKSNAFIRSRKTNTVTWLWSIAFNNSSVVTGLIWQLHFFLFIICIRTTWTIFMYLFLPFLFTLNIYIYFEMKVFLIKWPNKGYTQIFATFHRQASWSPKLPIIKHCKEWNKNNYIKYIYFCTRKRGGSTKITVLIYVLGWSPLCCYIQFSIEYDALLTRLWCRGE